MRKFNLFSRSALASAAASALAAGSGSDGDPEAGPLPNEEEDQGQDQDAAMDKPKPKDKTGCADDASTDAAAAGDDVVLLADAQAVAASQFEAGRKAERERTAAVFGSDAGKANPEMAAWMLDNNPGASASSIVDKLKTMPGASARPHGSTIADTNIDIGRGDAAAAIDEGASSDDVWAEVQGAAPAAPVINSDAGRRTLAALQNGAKTVNAAITPAAPALQPTGN